MILEIGEIFKLLAIDLLFLGLIALALYPLAVYKQAAFAVLKRNFIGYFSNPTGYVFLCLFVFLCSVAAFWPHEFFTANLANLDQLNKYLPYIMLMFIPAITMSIWAEERRQGTDELLLTLPAADFDIVMGKYLAAGSIFTASLLFSQMSTYLVLVMLSQGDIDSGLLISTYLGYWFVGLGMISVGMVASFLTNNLTVGFILGAAFNAPLAFASSADVISITPRLSRLIASWGILDNFDDFGRGVLSLSSLSYFAVLIALGLYLSMVLIGRRHWLGGRDGTSMLGHYLLRATFLLLAGIGLVLIFTRWDPRYDATEGHISSLSPDTLKLIRDLKTDEKVRIDLFVSDEVPDDYLKTRFELLSMLKEFQRRAPSVIKLTIHDNVSLTGEEARMAEERFEIRPERIRTESRGAVVEKELLMGAVFRCGLDRVVIPFFDYGVPIEYELIRSISTVAKDNRKKLGVVRTDAQLFGGFNMAAGRRMPREAIIDELSKQYDVREVDPNNSIPRDEYDALMVVQPSTLTPPQMENLIAAVESGVPTAIFEDPYPEFMQVVGTGAERPPAGGGMMGFGGGAPQPKGDLRKLWDLLGIEVPGDPGGPVGVRPDAAWQTFNPYPAFQISLPDSFIFISTEAEGGENSIRKSSEITNGLKELLFPMPGVIRKSAGSEMTFETLVETCPGLSGRISNESLEKAGQDFQYMKALQKGYSEGQILAARITGYPARRLTPMAPDDAAPDDAAPDDGAPGEQADEKKPDEAPAEPEEERPIKVTYVTDIDLLATVFLQLRKRPDDFGNVRFRFENVTFLLNLIDDLTDDNTFVAIRKRKPHLATLQSLEQAIINSRREEISEIEEFQKQFQKAQEDARKRRDQAIEKLQKEEDDLNAKRRAGESIDEAAFRDIQQRKQIASELEGRRFAVEIQRLSDERERKIEEIRSQTTQRIDSVRRLCRVLAATLPPLPPLLLGIFVFVQRKLRERESVGRNRARRV